MTIAILAFVGGADPAVAGQVYAKDYGAEYYSQGYFFDTQRGEPFAGHLGGTGPPGAKLQYRIVQPPQHGLATVDADGLFEYHPRRGFVGLDVLRVEVAGDGGGSDSAAVRIGVGPTAEDFVAALERRFPDRTHPRLLLTAEELSARFEAAREDVFLARTLAKIVAAADEVLGTEPETNFAPGVYRATIEHRYINLALAFKYTRERRYLDRLLRELRASCDPEAFPNWGEAGRGGEITFGQILCATAIVYDLLHDDFDPETRTLIEEAVVRNAHRPAHAALMAGDGIYGSFNNFNGIGSAGLAFSAMALIDAEFAGNPESRRIVRENLPKALRSMQRCMVSFQPDGAYYEGLGYGLWTLRHLALACAAAEKVFAFPLPAELTGAVYRSPEWFNAVRAFPTAFGNGEDATIVPAPTYPVSIFFATRAGRPDYAWPRRQELGEDGGNWQDFFFL